mgnify:CR=1 FL=1
MDTQNGGNEANIAPLEANGSGVVGIDPGLPAGRPFGYILGDPTGRCLPDGREIRTEWVRTDVGRVYAFYVTDPDGSEPWIRVCREGLHVACGNLSLERMADRIRDGGGFLLNTCPICKGTQMRWEIAGLFCGGCGGSLTFRTGVVNKYQVAEMWNGKTAVKIREAYGVFAVGKSGEVVLVEEIKK